MKFLARLVDSISILRIHDKNESLCAGVIVSPEVADLVLSSNVLKAVTTWIINCLFLLL